MSDGGPGGLDEAISSFERLASTAQDMRASLLAKAPRGHVTVGAGSELVQPRPSTGGLLGALLQDGTRPLHQKSRK